MEEFVVYILYSKKYDKTYRGQTTNLIARFKDHNELGKKGWARKYRPWEVVHVEFFSSRSAALKREKFLKSGKGRQWVKEQILKKI
ncbi:MAG TPA: GIY-YIG nuclease family protein [Flavobacteriaceae bacterium]|nr:GIY-YIG nuclease family protein [Flavobacteriaceae bacterium]